MTAQLTVDLAAANAATAAAQAAQATAEADLASATPDLTALRNPVEVALASANAETLAGTAGNDTFTGGSTFDADNVVDGSSTDNDTYTLTVAAGNASADALFPAAGGGNDAGSDVEIAPNITNVENVNMVISQLATWRSVRRT